MHALYSQTVNYTYTKMNLIRDNKQLQWLCAFTKEEHKLNTTQYTPGI